MEMVRIDMCASGNMVTRQTTRKVFPPPLSLPLSLCPLCLCGSFSSLFSLLSSLFPHPPKHLYNHNCGATGCSIT